MADNKQEQSQDTNADVFCATCNRETNELAIFPGGICLDCYRVTPAAERPLDTEVIKSMFGARLIRRPR